MSVPSTETRLWMALRGRIDTARGAIPVAWPGDGYEPGRAPYLSVADVPAPPVRRFIKHGGPHERSGILALVLRSPIAGLVYEQAREQAAQIAAAFPDGQEMTFSGVRVTIPRCAEVGGGYRDGSWWHTPINVPWRAFA